MPAPMPRGVTAFPDSIAAEKQICESTRPMNRIFQRFAKVPSQAYLQPVVLDAELTRGIWVTGHVTDMTNQCALVPVEVDYRLLAGNKAGAEKSDLLGKC